MNTLELDFKPYLRDAAVCFVPQVTDEQVDRVDLALRWHNTFTIVRRLTANTILVEGFPVQARSLREAEALTWELIAYRVRGALQRQQDAWTRITSIDVRESVGALCS